MVDVKFRRDSNTIQKFISRAETMMEFAYVERGIEEDWITMRDM